MDKRYWEKSCKYSIRKLSIGAASVLLGAVFLAAQGVAADGIEIPESEATITETSAKPDTKLEKVLASNTETQSIAESSEKQTIAEPELPQTSSQSDTSTATPPVENKESEKPELPVNKQEHYELHYNQPTAPSYDGWEKQALPVGNGEMGAKVFGLIGEERIQYNEKTLWSGGPQPDSQDYNGGNYKDRYKVLAEIRKALEDGDRQKAKRLAERNLVGPNNAQYGRYLAFGDIFMVFNNQKKGLENVTDYYRGLDISEAITTTSYTQDGTSFKRETFSSYPDDVTVTHLTKKGDKTLDFTLWNSLTEDLIANGDYSWENSKYKQGTVSVDSNGILLKGTVKDNGLKFASYLGIKTDGKVTAQDGYLTVTGASYATLLLSAKTNFAQNPKTNYRKDIDVEKTVKSIVDAAKAKDYETLKNDHIKDYQSLFNRVQLNLGGSKSNQTTKDALQTYNPTKGQKLEELFFQYGRYLLISSSRDRTDALPANLQGVWNAVDNPPWNSDYHLNVNLQMNYWPAYMSNLAETAKPMINYIDDMRYYGRIAAKEYAGIESKEGQENGWLVHTQATPFGWTTPGWNYYWGWSPAANAWMMQNVYDYYKFTKDETYLKEKIYPMLKETAKFWNSFLHYDKASDRWVSSPSYSPEHGTITIGNTFDQSLVWQLFHDYMEVANHLKVDQDLVTEVKAKFDKLKPLHINQDGRIKEWFEEDSPQFTNEGIENHHRHVSHLVGLFPGTLFSKDQPEYLEAARASLNHRGDGGTGWSKANKINLWARLLDGNRAHRLLAEQLKSSTLENLWDTHAPFQIDGNFGATSGMAEMLLQSHTGYIAPLPALPDAWKDGQVSGLVARGNFEVSMKWQEKNLESLTFLSNVGGDLVVDYPNIEASIVKVNGKEVQATRIKDNRIQLATQKGDVITFENFPGRVTRLTAVRKDAMTAELDFNPVKGASHYVIQRESKDENSQTPSVREFITNQTHFIDRSIDSSHAYTYTVKAMMGERSTPVSDVASIDAFSELVDDRDKRIQYGSAFGNWSDTDLFGGTEKYADLSLGNYSDKDATATIPFNGPGIEIYGLKSSQLGLADVKIDGKSVGELDFYTAGATEKGVLIGRYTNLSSGPHLMTITVKREHKGRANERAKISLDYFKVFPGQGEAVEKIDDRDPRIQYGSMFKDWSDAELYASTEKYADINADDSLASEATATIPFSGTGIRIYGLKTASLGKALVTLDGKEMPALDFYTPGATEKGALIGEFTNLADGDHVLTLKVDPNSPQGRKKVSLDSFDILKAPSVSLDSPSLEAVKKEDKTVTLTLPAGNWDAVAVTFPGIKDPLLLRKVDDDHLVTSGEQTVLTIKDNKIQLDIPEATDRKAGNSIEAYAIQGTTTTSPVVAVFPKDETAPVEEKILTSKGDEPAPVVTIPEYTDPIGTAGDQEAPSVVIPEYTGPIGTAGDQEAPSVVIPEYTEPIGTAGDQDAPSVVIPEYTEPIGTAGDQEAPSVVIPEYTEPIGTAGEQEAPSVVIPEYTDPIGTTGEQEAPSVVIPEYTKPIGTAGDQEAPSVVIPEYTEPIGTAGDQEAPSVVIPEYTEPIGTAGDQEAPSVVIPEYTEPIGTAGDQEVPSVAIPEYTEPIGTAGEQKAPSVVIPEYTEPIGTAGEQKAPSVVIPEYTEPIGTAGDQEAPTVERPEYTGLIGTAGEQEAPTVEIPEYTEPIGTAGDQEAPSVVIPEYTEPIGTAGDQEVPSVAIPEYTEPIGTAGEQKAPSVVIPEYTEPIGTAGDQEAPSVIIPEYTEPIGTAGDQEAPSVIIPEYTEPIGTAGDQEAPSVVIPEYTEPIGTAGDQEAPSVVIPEYTEPIGTAGNQEAPSVVIPEYTEPIGTAGDQEAPSVVIPEYTEPIGTAGDQEAPSITLSEFKLKVMKDKTTRAQVISGTTELEEASYLDSQKVENKELFGKKYDAYALQLKDKDGKPVQPKGAVLVRLPISGAVRELYQLTPTKDLKSQEFTIRDGYLEFISLDLNTYAIVYKTESETVKPVPVQTEETKVETTKPLAQRKDANDKASTNEKQLPATGEQTSPLLFMASLSLALSAAFLLKSKKD